MKQGASSEANTFAARLRQLRMAKGLAQGDIAKLLGIHKINYGRYERGESKPTTDTLSKLSDVFGVSTDYLLEGEKTDAAVANLEDADLLRMFVEIEKFSPKNKEAMKIVIDALIVKEKVNSLQTIAS